MSSIRREEPEKNATSRCSSQEFVSGWGTLCPSGSIKHRESRWCSGPVGLSNPRSRCQAWIQTHAKYERRARTAAHLLTDARFCSSAGVVTRSGEARHLSGISAHWVRRPWLTDNVLMNIFQRLAGSAWAGKEAGICSGGRLRCLLAAGRAPPASCSLYKDQVNVVVLPVENVALWI